MSNCSFATDGSSAVRLEGVVKRYPDRAALQGVSLRVARGELLALLGPAGSGKTTLIDVMAGIVPADAGEIFLDEVQVNAGPAAPPNVPVVRPSEVAAPHPTVADQVHAALCPGALPDSERASRVRDVLARVGLAALAEHPPESLTPAQRQHAALACALVTRPPVLLLDEPFARLDAPERAAFCTTLHHVRQALGLTLVLATQDAGQARRLADRIAVMRDGSIRQVAAPDDLYRNPQEPFVASCLGEVNVLPAHYHGSRADTIQLRLGAGLTHIPRHRLVGGALQGHRLDVYVRPEQITLEPLHGGSVLSGTVVRHVLREDHVDLYLDVPIPVRGSRQVVVRSGDPGSVRDWPVGAVASLVLPGHHVSVFNAPS